MNGYVFRVNEPAVVYEIFNNEIVLVNFESSHYYNLSNSGVDIWNLITKGENKETIINVLTFKYDGNESLIYEKVTSQLDELLKEGLIVISEKEDNKSVIKQATNSKKTPFVAPLLEKFSDMEELLLLDPIHEVQESGWPNKKI